MLSLWVFLNAIVCTFVYETWISRRKCKQSNNRFDMIISLNLIRWDLAISIYEYTSIRSTCWWYVIKYLLFKLVFRSLFFNFLLFFWFEFFFFHRSSSFSSWICFSIYSRSWHFESTTKLKRIDFSFLHQIEWNHINSSIRFKFFVARRLNDSFHWIIRFTSTMFILSLKTSMTHNIRITKSSCEKSS
jgi:membrane-associated HD superfamily phosphohydrolase